MDNKGRVTVVLHWDQRQHGAGSGTKSESGTAASSGTTTPKKQSSLVIQTSVDSSGKKETLINDVYPPRYTSSPQITVINHDDISGSSSSYGGIHHHPRLTKQGTSSFESTTIHIHTPECANHAHQPSTSRSGSPNNNVSECDFHCCALHEEGRKIAVHKSVADVYNRQVKGRSIMLYAVCILANKLNELAQIILATLHRNSVFTCSSRRAVSFLLCFKFHSL